MNKQNQQTRTILLPTFLILLSSISSLVFSADRLTNIEQDLLEESSITHLSADFVERKMSNTVQNGVNAKEVIIFDIREADEFAVSHLDNAIRVDPALSGEEFIQQFGAQLDNKDVIFYCSTGRRSTALAERVNAVIQARQSDTPVPANLRGGIFRWHNNDQPLVDNDGETDYVHPYNWWWKRLLSRKDFTRYEIK